MLAASANVLWWTTNVGRYGRFMRALQHPRAVQLEILNRYLVRNAATEFGRRFGFARIRSVHEYQSRVPLSDYEDYLQCIERIASGETHVLTSSPVRCFVPTSGSTSGEKLIPYTDEQLREFNRGIGPWIFDLYRRDPRLMDGRAYWSVSPVAQDARRRGVVPVGFEDDSAYVGGLAKRLVEAALAVPANVRHIRDIESFRYVTLLHLLCCDDLRLISVWHPSFLTLLLDALEPNWDRLLRDLACNPRARRRAAALRYIGPQQPQRIWSKLRLISCWTDAAAALALPALRRLFPTTSIQGKGLLATEGFITLPLGSHRPLAIRSHFFEFIDETGRARLADELSAGQTYSMVLTTAGGLYRYRMRDLVTVDGFVGRTPALRFIGKEQSVCDLCGEKLSEGFAVAVITSLCARLEINARFAMLVPQQDQLLPRYTLYIESDRIPDGLAETLDDALCENPHYRYCRRLGQLAAAQAFVIRDRAYAAYVQRLCDEGQRPGNIKPCALSTLAGWDRVFAGALVDSVPPTRRPAAASL